MSAQSNQLPELQVHDLHGLSLAVRLIGNLRIEAVRLSLSPLAFPNIRQLKEKVNACMQDTEGLFQLRQWQCSLSSFPGWRSASLQFQFMDGRESRLAVRTHVYEQARRLTAACHGKPDIAAICHAVNQEIRYGSAAPNPHCVSDALASGNGVCQAIALYLWQLLIRCGYPSLMQSGTVNGPMPHAWNLVKTAAGWKTLDLCVSGPADYQPQTFEAPEDRFARLLAGQERVVDFSGNTAVIPGLGALPMLGGSGRVRILPFLSAYNGGFRLLDREMLLYFGIYARKIPCPPELIPSQYSMPVEQFARLFGLACQGKQLRFCEPL